MNTYPIGKRPRCLTCPSFGRKTPNTIATVGATQCHACYCDGKRKSRRGRETPTLTVSQSALEDRLLQTLKRERGIRLKTLSAELRLSQAEVKKALLGLQQRGINVHAVGDSWALAKAPASGTAFDIQPYVSRPDGSYVFGAMGDTHLGSKYARLDVLRDLYGVYAAAGVDRVFHTGNWIDGEANFNKYDLLVHGLDAQIDYLIHEYPQIPRVTTYAVSGNDHEGWLGQREGIDIGRHCALKMQADGRNDWRHLGHIEAFIPLRHAQTGKTSMLHVMHPGGGSAYAVSYTVQKIVEGYEGGEKPAVLLAGHYHKMAYLRTRNVCTIQTGCTQDITPWARSKKLRYEIGGWIVRLQQDAKTGAITRCQIEDFPYFNKGFYSNRRWSHAGDVEAPRRSRP